MKFHINANGNTYDTLREHNVKLREAVDNMQTVLNAMTPHGRNYQTLAFAEGALREDMAEHRAAWDGLTKLHAYLDAHTDQMVLQGQRKAP